MNGRRWSVAIAGLVHALILNGSGEAAEPPPNLVLIVMDDLGWADLGCYGSTFYETPNLDRLATRGLRFTNGYAACPVCSPSRAALMTGQYPARLNLTDWLPGRPDRPDQRLLRPKIHQALPREIITLAEVLKPAGYVSASIGKWHLGGTGSLPEDQGFDINLGGTQVGSPPSGYFGFKTPSLSLRPGEYLPDRLTDEAEAFIEKNKDRPFFLYLPHYAVHIPLQAKPELVAKYKAKAVGSSAQNNPVYAAMIESMDQSVGRIMHKLDELKLTDRTIFLFTSDNGGLSVKEGPNTPATVNAPLRAGKGYLYEGGIRVPFLVSWPGATQPGRVSDVPVCGIDLVPTMIEVIGREPSAGQTIDGESLVSLFKGTGQPKREALYWHYPHYSNQGGKPGAAIRQADWKLIEFYEDGQLELYDLKSDLREQHNLAESRPGDVARLRKHLASWRTAVNAQMPRPNPDYQPPKR